MAADDFPLGRTAKGGRPQRNNPTVIEAILTGKPYPVRAMHVSGVNIAVIPRYAQDDGSAEVARLPRGRHAHDDPTAALADIVLPKTTGLEDEEVSLEPSAQIVCVTAPVKDPDGWRAAISISTDLAKRLEARGVDTRRYFPWETKQEFNEYLAGDGPIDWADLKETGWASSTTRWEISTRRVSGRGTARSSYGRNCCRKSGLDPLPEFVPPAAVRADATTRAAYPLDPSHRREGKTYHHSRYRDQGVGARYQRSPSCKLIRRRRRTGAGGRRLDGGGNSRGRRKCRLRVRITDDIQPGILRTGMGWWYPESEGPEFAPSTSISTQQCAMTAPATRSQDRWIRGLALPHRQDQRRGSS